MGKRKDLSPFDKGQIVTGSQRLQNCRSRQVFLVFNTYKQFWSIKRPHLIELKLSLLNLKGLWVTFRSQIPQHHLQNSCLNKSELFWVVKRGIYKMIGVRCVAKSLRYSLCVKPEPGAWRYPCAQSRTNEDMKVGSEEIKCPALRTDLSPHLG